MKKIGLSLISGIILVGSISLVSAALDITTLLNQWNQSGVFSYMLPFLLVFALVYGILGKSEILGSNAKGVNVIIALTLGLLSLFSPFPDFIMRMAPKLAIGISILLAAIIFLGLFLVNSEMKNGITYALIGVGAIAFLAMTYSSFQGDWAGYNLWNQYGPALITALILIALIVVVVKWGSSDSSPTAKKT